MTWTKREFDAFLWGNLIGVAYCIVIFWALAIFGGA